jgi:hypothetical protein
MLVRLEKVPPRRPMTVRVHSPIGGVTVRWRGDPDEADGLRHVEWSVDEEIAWGRNTRPAAIAEPRLLQEGDRIVLCGRLHLTGDGAAALEMGDAQILFDVATPPTENIDRAWVEISVQANAVTLWPSRL